MIEGYHLKQQLSRLSPGRLAGATLDVNENEILILLLSNLFHHLLNSRESEGTQTL